MKRNLIFAAVIAAAIVGLMVYTQSNRPAPAPKDSVEQANIPGAERPVARRHTVLEPAEALVTTNTPTPAEASTNWLAGWMKSNNIPLLTLEQAEVYVQQNRRGVEALLAADEATSHGDFLREAMEKFPNDPRVAFRAAFYASPEANEEESAQARRQWLDVLKQSAPDNALGDYLSAAAHFKTGEKELALKELVAAGNKPLQDYSQEFMLNAEEAYRSAGYSEAQAKTLATVSLRIPQMSQYKEAGVSLVELANSYQQAGDTASAQAALQMAVNLGQRFSDPDSLTLIEPLVGIAIQRRAFEAMGANTPFGETGRTVQDQLDALKQQREAIRVVGRQADLVETRMSDPDLVSYFNRQRLYGERAALQWAIAKFNPK